MEYWVEAHHVIREREGDREQQNDKSKVLVRDRWTEKGRRWVWEYCLEFHKDLKSELLLVGVEKIKGWENRDVLLLLKQTKDFVWVIFLFFFSPQNQRLSSNSLSSISLFLSLSLSVENGGNRIVFNKWTEIGKVQKGVCVLWQQSWIQVYICWSHYWAW